MASWVDHKYVSLMSNRLTMFKQTNKETYTFRCPICGDSQKSKIKSRGYIFPKGGKLRFYCHNCGASMHLGQLIKEVDGLLYEDYIKEQFIETNFKQPVREIVSDITNTTPPRFISNSPLGNLKKISQLEFNHPAKRYIDSRKIPPNKHFKLFYAPKFKHWVNSFIPNKFSSLTTDEPRIVIPLLDKNRDFFGCQGRALSDKGPRYYTIILNDETPRLFGLDTCDLNKYTYCFEGPIDSLFIPNAIAMCGSDLTKNMNMNKRNMVICFDNEPRSLQIVEKISKYIDNEYNVCLWPSNIKGKDINEMILNGHPVEELTITIDKNTFSGLDAKLKLQMWRKC